MTHQRLLISLQLLLAMAGAALSGAPAAAQAAPAPPSTAVSDIEGQYAFFLSGQESAGAGATELVAIAGSVTTDGAGNITAGVVDKNSGSGVIQTQAVHGTYQLDSTGKGSFTITTPQGNFGFTFYTTLPLVLGSVQGTIVAGAGPLLHVSGELGPADRYFSPQGNPTAQGSQQTFAFTEVGESVGGTNPFSGSGTLNFTAPTVQAPGTIAGTVAASGLLVSNGTTTSFSALNGTFTGPIIPDSNGYPTRGTGRFTMAIPASPGSSTMENYVGYSGAFLTGTLFFLSVDPHPASTFTVSTSVRSQFLTGQ